MQLTLVPVVDAVADPSLPAGLTRERVIRAVQSHQVDGSRVAGRWLCDPASLRAWAESNARGSEETPTAESGMVDTPARIFLADQGDAAYRDVEQQLDEQYRTHGGGRVPGNRAEWKAVTQRMRQHQAKACTHSLEAIRQRRLQPIYWLSFAPESLLCPSCSADAWENLGPAPCGLCGAIVRTAEVRTLVAPGAPLPIDGKEFRVPPIVVQFLKCLDCGGRAGSDSPTPPAAA